MQPIARELVAEGAQVVWLAGSRARGDAGPHSDVDLGVLTHTYQRRYRVFRMIGGTLASIVWTTTAATRASFSDPAQLGGAVPGWRRAHLLHDPDGIGTALQAEAQTWTWRPVEAACDAWVARDLTQLGEEVHKLFNALAAGDDLVAAIRRNVLVQRLPMTLSVRRRILYDSEKLLWRCVADDMGAEWEQAQRDALAIGGAPFPATIGASLRLYSLAVDACRPLLSNEQLAVSEAALALIATHAAGI